MKPTQTKVLFVAVLGCSCITTILARSNVLLAGSVSTSESAVAHLPQAVSVDENEVADNNTAGYFYGARKLLAACTYTIKSGDTFWALAQRFGTTVAELQRLNPRAVPTNLKIGQVITIPAGSCGGGGGGGKNPAGGNVLYQGSGSGTYYYDLRTTCPQDSWGYAENDGYPACASWTPGTATYKTLRQLGSNNVIAIDANLLASNRAKYCGKKVIVKRNGVQVSAPGGGDFFVWDGCAACIGGRKIDFSVSGLRKAASDACTLGVVPGVTWQVVDVAVKQFIP